MCVGYNLLKQHKFISGFFFSYEYAGSVITYDDNGDGDDYKTATFASDQTTFNWDTVTLGTRRDHAIHARITPSIISPSLFVFLLL